MDYEPGTVAVATVHGVPNVRVFRRYNPDSGMGDWAYAPDPRAGLNYSCDSDISDAVHDVRPLVVLDLRNFDRVVEILREYAEGHGWGVLDNIADQIEAQTSARRIPEPSLWAVVEASWDSKGPAGLPRAEWVRVKGNLWHSSISGVSAEWAELIDPTLIRPGIND